MSGCRRGSPPVMRMALIPRLAASSRVALISFKGTSGVLGPVQ